MIYGIIDIGSNTVRLNVYFYENDNFDLIFSKKCKLGLEMYVKNGILTKKGLDNLEMAINNMKRDLMHLKIKKYSYFATASLRNINNSNEIIKKIEKQTKIKIDLLSSEKEGKLGFVGFKKIFKREKGILVDIGGGSTEITFFNGKTPQILGSMPIGSLNLYHRYVSELIPNKQEHKTIKKRVFHEIKKLKIEENKEYLNYSVYEEKKHLYGIGGTFRNVEKLLLNLNIEKKGNAITPNSLKILEKELYYNDKKTFNKILKVNPSRIHTIVPGLLIIDVLSSYLDCCEIYVSKFGLREGYLEKFAEDG